MSEENKIDIFSIAETPVTLTYTELGVPAITFYLRPFLQREEQEMRQAHFALTDAAREKAQHAHNVEMLAELSTRAPEGLKGMNGNKDVKGALKNLLKIEKETGTPEEIRVIETKNAMKVKVVADALTMYYRNTQPKEFFRGL